MLFAFKQHSCNHLTVNLKKKRREQVSKKREQTTCEKAKERGRATETQQATKQWAHTDNVRPTL